MTELVKGICRLGVTPMRSEPAHKAEMVNQLLFGEHYTVLDKTNDQQWFFIRNYFDNYEGWIHSYQHHEISKEYFDQINHSDYKVCLDVTATILYNKHPLTIVIGSILPISGSELFRIEEQLAFNGEAKSLGQKRDYEFLKMVTKKYLNAPYLWGGKTPFGIDCSGLVQQVFKLCGYRLPRDSYQQADQGKDIDYRKACGGDLGLFVEGDREEITHVGIILDGESIIHASGHVKIDKLVPEGIYNNETRMLTHKLVSVKRILTEQ